MDVPGMTEDYLSQPESEWPRKRKPFTMLKFCANVFI